MSDAPQRREPESPWKQLRRRKVVQWILAYGAGAWGFLQVLEYVSETYGWPPQLRKAAILALLVGLPIVAVIAWFHGDRGNQRIPRSEVVILALLGVLGAAVFWRFQPEGGFLATGPAPTEAAESRSAAAVAADPRPSIAVLPFENRSALEEDVFFVGGIHDDVLTQLARIGTIRVIARSSVEQFRDSRLPIHEIADRLGVTTILEGGVQRAGNRIRVTVQLIDAASEGHLWADTFDRELTAANIFAIQTEVAASIAQELRATLAVAAPAETARRPSTENLQAWELVQRAVQRWDAGTDESQAEAIALLERAIAVDPTFTQAHVELAPRLVRSVYRSGTRRDVVLARAETAAETALQLDPTLADAWIASAMVAGATADNERLESRLRRALELNPNLADAQEMLSDLLWYTGRRQESRIHLEKARALDPMSVGIGESLAMQSEAEGRTDEAEEHLRRLLKLHPDDPGVHMDLGQFEAYVRNRFTAAVPLLERAVELDPGDAYLAGMLAMVLFDLGSDADATRLVQDALRRWPDRSNVLLIAAWLALYRGDQDGAVRHARRLLESNPKHWGGVAVLAQADLAQGDVQSARARYAIAFPELLGPEAPEIGPENAGLALSVARILLRTGERERALALIKQTEEVHRTMPRLASMASGYGINDALVHALRGEDAKALRALRAAAAAGFRGPLWRVRRDYSLVGGWMAKGPEFAAVFAEIERDLARQRAELEAR